MSYRGTYETRQVVSIDGDRTNPVRPLPGVQIQRWSWPVGYEGGLQLARAILYDFLGWTPCDPVPQRFMERFLKPLPGRDWEISHDEISAWWQAQKAGGIVVFNCSNKPSGEVFALLRLVEACHRHDLVTFLPFDGAENFNAAQLQRSLDAARGDAQWEVSFVADDSDRRALGSIVAGTSAGLERLRRIMPHDQYAAIDLDDKDKHPGEELIAVLLGR